MKYEIGAMQKRCVARVGPMFSVRWRRVAVARPFAMRFLGKRPLRREIDKPRSSGWFVSKRVSGRIRGCAPGPDALIPPAGGRPSWSPIRREPRELRQDNLSYRSVTRPAFGENPTAKSSTGKAPQGVVRKCGAHRGVGAGVGRSHVEDCRPSMRAQPKAARVGKHLSHSIPRVSYFAGGNLPSFCVEGE